MFEHDLQMICKLLDSRVVFVFSYFVDFVSNKTSQNNCHRSPTWSSGQDPALSPPWPGFDSRCGNVIFFLSHCVSIIPSTNVIQLTLTQKMTTAQVVETSVTVNNNSPIQDYVHPDDQTKPTFEMTPGFKPFTKKKLSKFTQERYFYTYCCSCIITFPVILCNCQKLFYTNGQSVGFSLVQTQLIDKLIIDNNQQ